jgi:hypothetical protein
MLQGATAVTSVKDPGRSSEAVCERERILEESASLHEAVVDQGLVGFRSRQELVAPTGAGQSRTSTIISISTACPRGSEAIPTAARAWRPRSPNTATIKSEKPLITAG